MLTKVTPQNPNLVSVLLHHKQNFLNRDAIIFCKGPVNYKNLKKKYCEW